MEAAALTVGAVLGTGIALEDGAAVVAVVLLGAGAVALAGANFWLWGATLVVAARWAGGAAEDFAVHGFAAGLAAALGAHGLAAGLAFGLAPIGLAPIGIAPAGWAGTGFDKIGSPWVDSGVTACPKTGEICTVAAIESPSVPQASLEIQETISVFGVW